jgi:nicotinamide mononucleotide transporter
MKGMKTMSFSNIMPNKAQDLKVHLIQGVVLGVFLTGLSYIVGLQAGWLVAVNWLEVFAVFTSYVCTFLCVVERRANYPIGAISNAAYCLLFFQFGLYASAATTGYLTFALAYGWFRWRSDSEAIPVRHLELKWVPAYVLATAAFYGLALLLVTAIGGTLALTDTVILIGTMLAQFLLDNKRIETWAVWVIVNIFAIYTYSQAGLAIAAFQYVFFLANAFYGWYMWNKSKAVATQPATGLVVKDKTGKEFVV